MPVLSVCLITYNHESYIRQAIESILAQKVSFKWELIIADDCSTDNTRPVLIEYKEKHPDFITLILQERNVGPAKNWMDLLAAPKSGYIAYLEGDDYWTDPLKLQKQVDILENHPDCILCFTGNSVLSRDGIITPPPQKNIAVKTGFQDLLQENYIATLTVVFRNKDGDGLPAWFGSLAIGDWPLYLWLLRNGDKAYFLNDDTAVYRHGIGLSADMRRKKNLFIKKMTGIFQYMEKDISFIKYKSALQECINGRNIYLMKSLVQENQLLSAARLYAGSVSLDNCAILTRSVFTSVLKKIKLSVRDVLNFFQALRYLVSFLLSDIKKIRRSKFIFLIPVYHTGGAERVHLNILKALGTEKKCTLFTENSATKNFFDEFGKHSEVIEINKILARRNKFINSIFNRLLVSQFNNNAGLKAVFSSNTRYFYEILPKLDKSITRIDLFHAFTNPDHRENNIINSVGNTDYRVVINKKAKKDLEAIYKKNHIDPGYSRNIIIIENAIELNENGLLPKAAGKIKVGYAGRWSDEKRPELFLRISKEVKAMFQETAFVMAGTGMKSNIGKISDAGIDFLGEITKKEAMEDFYNSLTFLLITSEREGFPMVIMESMACGVIPLSTNVGGIDEHIIHQQNGILINEHNDDAIVEAFVRALKGLILSPEKREYLSENAFKYASENFGTEEFNKKYRALFAGNGRRI